MLGFSIQALDGCQTWNQKRANLPECIVLIGMPGAGKSTIGVLLAKQIAYDFVDTDLLIQSAAGKTLQEIFDENGFDAFCQLEEEVVCHLNVQRHVIATGGSAVYGRQAVAHLKSLGKLVYLETPFAIIEQRLTNLATRGVALRSGQTLQDLYEERSQLYKNVADVTVDCGNSVPHEVLQKIVVSMIPNQK